MWTRLGNLWNRIQASLWFVPTLMSAAAVGLWMVTHRLDRWISGTDAEWLAPWLYRGDLEGARTLLGTVAGSMMTVAGVTFSVTVVALTMASAQFGPRLLVNFMRDRGNQIVLGTFIATFVYCLLALGATGVQADVKPAASASVGLLLAVASVAVLIYFIHHVATSIRADHVVDVVAQDVNCVIDRILVDDENDGVVPEEAVHPEGLDPARAAFVSAHRSGYIQAVDEEGLFDLARSEEILIELLERPGNFSLEGQPLVAVHPREGLDDSLADEIRSSVIIGRVRTGEQDPEYGIRQLVEVAVRALSPGVNDPHTAISCLDWLGAVLHRVAKRRLRPAARQDETGALRLLADRVTYDGLVKAAFDEIRQECGGLPAVSIHMLEVLASVARGLEEPDRAAALQRQADMLLASVTSNGLQKEDQLAVEERHREVLDAVEDCQGASRQRRLRLW